MSEQELDWQIVQRVQQGDKAAFNVLVKKYQHRIANLISRYVSNHGDVADVAQEVEAVHAAEPVGVVRHNSGVFAFKAQKRFQLVADAFYPAGNGFGGIQAAFCRFKAWVADHAGRAAHQSNRRMPRLLETAQCQYGQQVTDMQAVGCWVETAVEGDFLFV